MWKSVLAGTTALAIAGGSLVYAQQRADGPGAGQRWRPTAEDIGAFTDARIAGLKAGLKLTPEQEKNWPAVEAAVRDLAKQRSERFAARASATRPNDPIERLRTRADTMTQAAAGLKKLADASAPLYQSLDEGQKRRFMALSRIGGRQFGHEHGRRHGGMRGPDRDGPRPQ
jgi:hypothetical protein